MRIRKLYIVILLFVVNIPGLIRAQDTDSLYTLDIYAGIGYGYYITDMNVNDLNKGGINTSIRIMWQPDHLLSIGLQTGYLQFYSLQLQNVETIDGYTDVDVSLTAVPIGILFSMRIIDGLNISAGTSLYILNSKADTHGNEVISSELSTGSVFELTYTRPLNKSIALGGEIRYNFVNKIQDGSLSLQAVLKYKLLEY